MGKPFVYLGTLCVRNTYGFLSGNTDVFYQTHSVLSYFYKVLKNVRFINLNSMKLK